MKNLFRHSALIAVALILFTACKKKGDSIVVYPNPASSYIILDASSNSSKHKNGDITIKNTVGDVIKTFKTNDSSYIRWQIDSFQGGIYYYTYTADKMKTQTGRIVFN